MSRIKDLLFDVESMKIYAKYTSKIITRDMSKLGKVYEDELQDAILARYQLDKILLDKQNLIEKWAQWIVRDIYNYSVKFRDTQSACLNFIIRNRYFDSKLSYVFPDDYDYDWYYYFNDIKKRSNIEIK